MCVISTGPSEADARTKLEVQKWLQRIKGQAKGLGRSDTCERRWQRKEDQLERGLQWESCRWANGLSESKECSWQKSCIGEMVWLRYLCKLSNYSEQPERMWPGMDSWVGPKGFVVTSFIPVDFSSREYLSYAHPRLPPVVHSPQLTLPFTYDYESSPPQFPWASPSWKETYKRETSGINCSPCYCSWSWNPVRLSSPPHSTIHSRLPSPSASSSEGLGDLLCCDPNPHSRVVQDGLTLPSIQCVVTLDANYVNTN